MLELIIFDMDGVLINTPKYVWKSFNQLLKRYGIRISDAEIKNKYLGRSLRDQLEMIKKEHDIKESINLDEFSNNATNIQLELIKDIKINKDVLSLFKSAKKEKIKVAVATSSVRSRAEKILSFLGILDKLDLLITAGDIDKHKPNPDIFLKAAEKLRIESKDCIVFEDAINGIIAAKNANMKVVGLVTEYHTRKDLKDADLVINNFSEINLDILKRLGADHHNSKFLSSASLH